MAALPPHLLGPHHKLHVESETKTKLDYIYI